MASTGHAVTCPKCQNNWFREDKIVILDSTVVVREGLPIPARAMEEQYRYTCVSCGHVLDEPWTGHHDER